ncbi:glycosyltransferase family 2 protein [Anabaena aphanizomenioides LEGE 00250]|uniref:Glycosyl transferase, family 2 n=2 Tax=Sphaerospermopsis TaxID=752201 RepID=A0A480A6I6_9CYAN|nr:MULTISPECIES: glycosyltransferase family 2 protein [Sphaerospermopsis]MBE9236231.1 glycosyltransferase family 2 protein [Sphaerospermopsis aphanizomenoides LEGE 00250]GCL39303.1 glycosyl transferase, family 2 [Sphaerospermopsis reniformis]
MQYPEKIAIVLATFNPNLEYLQKQIQSIKNQDYKNWVCYIVDDCSETEYQIAIQEIIAKDSRFVCHFHKHNLHHYYNFERGLNYCFEDGNITAIALADQDDIWYPEKLNILIKTLRSEQAILVHSDLQMIDSNDEIIHDSTWNFEGRNPEKFSTDLLLLRNVVTGCSVLFCSSLLKEILPFPEQEKISWYHDWWIALVAAQKGKIVHIHQPLVSYRIHGLNNVGVTRDAGKIYPELSAWISKNFKITGNSYLVHRNFSQAFYERFQQELDDENWSNPFDDKKLDFGVNILKLFGKSLLMGYNSEGIALKIWVLKIIFDLKKIIKSYSLKINKHYNKRK